ncbi:hypothetical protein Lal_00013229 [Lupinus albus]|nr:hypothetical protein Lal_00013229 [Lupinus albus]
MILHSILSASSFCGLIFLFYRSTGKKQKGSSGSASKRTTKIVNGKQSCNKHVKNGQKGASKSIFHQEDAKESSEISDREETMISEAEMNSGGSEGEQAEESDEIITKEKKSKKKVKSVSRGKGAKKKKSLRYRQESDEEKQESKEEKQDSEEEKQNYGERHSEESESVPQGVQSDEENSSKERHVDESGGSTRENVNEEESGSEGNQNNSDDKSGLREEKKSPKELTSLDGARIAEVSDHEPLSKWKLPSRKKSSGKKR